MAGNLTNSLIAQILSTDDSTANVPINFGTGNPAFDSTSADFTRYFVLTAPNVDIGLTKNPATCVYIKNIDVAKTITVIWTPNGGASNSVILLNPGDQIILWCSPIGATTPGITDLKLNASAFPCLCEFFIGG